MSRHLAAVVVALCLTPSWLWAQNTQFTVSVDSATVRKSPSTGSPVVGQAPRGTVLQVTRDVGAWIRVSWPEAQDGFGYVHYSMGSLSRQSTMEQRLTAATPAAADPALPPTTVAADVSTAAGQMPVPAGTTYIAPPTHFVGLGGRMASSTMGGFGFTSRIWSRNRLGVQLEASQSTLESSVAPERMRSMQFAPSVIYSFRDRVTDDIWVRPYLGAGVPISRSTLQSGTPWVSVSESKNTYGVRAFGGGELTFPSVARFALSLDLGYLWSQTPFPGYELGGIGFSLSGHWYVK
jgi:hypothetical protein